MRFSPFLEKYLTGRQLSIVRRVSLNPAVRPYRPEEIRWTPNRLFCFGDQNLDNGDFHRYTEITKPTESSISNSTLGQADQ